MVKDVGVGEVWEGEKVVVGVEGCEQYVKQWVDCYQYYQNQKQVGELVVQYC